MNILKFAFVILAMGVTSAHAAPMLGNGGSCMNTTINKRARTIFCGAKSVDIAAGKCGSISVISNSTQTITNTRALLATWTENTPYICCTNNSGKGRFFATGNVTQCGKLMQESVLQISADQSCLARETVVLSHDFEMFICNGAQLRTQVTQCGNFEITKKEQSKLIPVSDGEGRAFGPNGETYTCCGGNPTTFGTWVKGNKCPKPNAQTEQTPTEPETQTESVAPTLGNADSCVYFTDKENQNVPTIFHCSTKVMTQNKDKCGTYTGVEVEAVAHGKTKNIDGNIYMCCAIGDKARFFQGDIKANQCNSLLNQSAIFDDNKNCAAVPSGTNYQIAFCNGGKLAQKTTKCGDITSTAKRVFQKTQPMTTPDGKTYTCCGGTDNAFGTFIEGTECPVSVDTSACTNTGGRWDDKNSVCDCSANTNSTISRDRKSCTCNTGYTNDSAMKQCTDCAKGYTKSDNQCMITCGENATRTGRTTCACNAGHTGDPVNGCTPTPEYTACVSTGGTWENNKCSCGAASNLTDNGTGGCKCISGYEDADNNPSTACTITVARQTCEKDDGTWTDTGCSCTKFGLINDANTGGCTCPNGYGRATTGVDCTQTSDFAACEYSGGEYANSVCSCNQPNTTLDEKKCVCTTGYLPIDSDVKNGCEVNPAYENCIATGGTWANSACTCNAQNTKSTDEGCVCNGSEYQEIDGDITNGCEIPTSETNSGNQGGDNGTAGNTESIVYIKSELQACWACASNVNGFINCVKAVNNGSLSASNAVAYCID